MPAAFDIRQSIAAALAGFAKRPLPEAATEFFASLGYHSQRRMEYPSLAACLAEFDKDGKAAKFFPEISNPKHAKPVTIQQLTSAEIAAGSDGTLSLFKPSGLDPRQFESYLFFTVPLPDADYSRTELAVRARALNSLFTQPVLVLFRHGANISLAITYRRTSKRDQSRDIIERKVTLIKDIACASPHRAHLDILADFALENLAERGGRIDTFAKLDDAWRRVLSTQQLNESFYSELSKWYYWATSTIQLPLIPDHLKHRKDAQDENIKQFTIRLLCRSIFCWFLKERKLITPSLLEIADVTGEPVIHTRPAKSAAEFAKSNSYYRGILQNVFFNCLNTPMDQRRLTAARAANDKTVKDPQLKKLAYRGKNYLPDDFDYSLFDKIPYLNGGLFDCLPEDNASDTIDDEKISVPNKLFYAERVELKSEKKTIEVSGLNRILERYKFTITENTPLEEEIALDPELLGLVFENLLAEVDVSDEGAAKSARKASGSYYTPRRVIDYMVNESLRLHLEGFCKQRGASADEIAALTELIYHDEFDTAKHARLAEWIVEAFDTIRILDPACGSGAFPMGALHRMVDILRRVDVGNELWLHRQVSAIPDLRLRQKAETDLKRHADDYSRKLGLIKNAIYGVDIQPLAVLLTKLRFFISLLVDQRLVIGDTAGNYGLTPLPNLETKVICANTLRELQVSLFEREAIRRYQTARDEYYQPDTVAERRAELADDIAGALADLLPSFAKDVTGQEIKDRATQTQRNRELLKEWFRHSSIPAPFFNFSVFFPEVCPVSTISTLPGEFGFVNEAQRQGDLAGPMAKVTPSRAGFDLVIGNPPYGGTKLPDDVREALALSSKDPYGAFIARFLGDGRKSTPLKPDGILAYIVSDTFMTIKTHRPLREQLMGSRVHKIIRCHADTFNAVVNTAIIVAQKGGGPGAVAPADDVLAKLWEGPQRGPWCQMVDLTQVSIHQQHDRFLTLLFDTAGAVRRRDIATESCAAYHYPQALIATNSNLPFFIASPKLFALMNDTTAPLSFRELGGKRIQVRTIRMNGCDIEVTKLEQIAEVKVGLQTGDNESYLFQNPEAHGTYRSIVGHKKYLLTEADLEHISEDKTLRQELVERGISKDDKKSPRYFGGRYIAPYDKGGESDSNEGWMPNYHVPTDYFIDWSEWAVKRMQTLTTLKREGSGPDKPCARFQNTDTYFLQGITYSPTGEYSPSFRFGSGGICGNKGSSIFSSATNFSVPKLISVLASRAFRFVLKNYRSHTVESSEQGLLDSVIPISVENRIGKLSEKIATNQRRNKSYDYATNEQLEIDHLVYAAYGLNRADIAEVETWYARRYETLADAQRQNLRRAGKVPAIDGWNVYCDETGHLPCDRAPEMILGAMLVPHDQVKPLTLKLRERLAKLGWPRSKTGDWAELKWTKVSPGGLKFYEAALDFFLTEPDLRFRALIAPKSPPPPKLPKPPAGSGEPGSPAWEKYHALLEATAPAVVDHQQRHDAWYYDRYFDLLRDTLLPPAHHTIYVDVKDTRGGARIKSLESRLSDAHYDWSRSGIVEGVRQIHSDEVLLDQLVDVLLGCVAWTHATPQRNEGHIPSPAKSALAKKFQTALAKLDGALVPKVVIDRSSERSPAA